MKKTNKITALCLGIAFLLLTLAAVVVRTVLVLTAYEADANYYAYGAPSYLPFILSFTAGICGLILALTVPKSPFAAKEFYAPKYRFATLPASVGFLAAGVLMIRSGSGMSSLCLALLCFLSAAALLFYAVSAYFFPSHLAEPAFASPVALSGFLCVITCILLCGVYYFDQSLEMNAPLKTATQSALLLLMLFFTGEIRGVLGRPLVKLHLIVSSVAVAFGAPSALGYSVAFFAGKSDRPGYAAGAILCLCVIPTVLLRMSALLSPAFAPIPVTSDKEGEETV